MPFSCAKALCCSTRTAVMWRKSFLLAISARRGSSLSLKVVMTTQDGKILAETIIKSTQPFINSNDILKINHLILTNKKYNNATIRAIIMKKIEFSS